MDDDIGWNDFALRNYDAQIGRWMQQDPFQEFASPYMGMGIDPINTIDPSRGNIFSGLTPLANAGVRTLLGAIIGTAADLISGGDGDKGLVFGALAGLGSAKLATATQTLIQTSRAVVTKLNTSSITQASGSATTGLNNSATFRSSSFSQRSIFASNQQKSRYAPWAGYNPNQPTTVDNTKEAWDHYINGKGEPVNIGPNTTLSSLTSREFKYHEARIVSGQTTAMSGSFSVNMTKRVFHIGRTNVDYFINCGTKNCTVTFNLFVRDGFWDVDFIDEKTLGKTGLKRYQPDGMGPNLERFGGHPYSYNPIPIKFNFINPGYKSN